MSEQKPDGANRFYARQFQDIDEEVAKWATVCGVDFLDREQLARAMQGDATVASKGGPEAFEKLKTMLRMHMAVRERAAENLSQAEAQQLIDEIVTQLQARYKNLRG